MIRIAMQAGFRKRLVRSALALSVLLMTSASVYGSASPPAIDLDQNLDLKDQASAATKVFSCALHFPLDSVRFDESMVGDCFKEVSVERISYIHVIATASPDGSSRHNLYLSTRRAGAIEGYLRNRFPNVEIHAFGGGANEKFGKMARVFIVESAPAPQIDHAGPSLVIDSTPPPQVQAKVEYVHPEKIGVDISGGSGLAYFSAASGNYQFVNFSGAYTLPNRWMSDLQLGVRYSIHRSNQYLDVHTHHMFVNKTWHARTIKKFRFDYGTRAFAGLASTLSSGADLGAAGFVSVRAFDLLSAIEVGQSLHFRWIGLSLGTLI
jgi:hypothetical protein